MVRRSRYAAALDRDPASGARRGVEEGGSKIETITPPSLPPPIPKVEQHPLPFFKRSRNLKRCVREENLFILSLRERLSRDEMILLFIFFFLSFFLLFFFFLEHFWTNKVSQEFSHWSRIRHRIATLSFLASKESLFFFYL